MVIQLVEVASSEGENELSCVRCCRGGVVARHSCNLMFMLCCLMTRACGIVSSWRQLAEKEKEVC